MIKFYLVLMCFFGLLSTVLGQSVETRFKPIKPSYSGIKFKNSISETVEWNYFRYMDFYNGGGVAVGDLNNDGLPDLYFTGNMVSDRLYKNLGKLKFKDVSRNANIIDAAGWTTGVTMADVNGDGLLDIYVCKAGGNFFSEKERCNKLFINRGDFKFEEMSKEYGLDDAGYSVQSTFFDYDNDGDLDLYVVNHPGDFNLLIDDRVKKVSNPSIYESDHLYRQESDGKFTQVSVESGILNWAFGLSVVSADLNADGFVDLYVGNDFSERDNYWVNQGNGTFKEGLFSSFNHISNFSMGCDIADFNNDTLLEICVVDMVAADTYRKKTNMSGMNEQVFYDNVKNGGHYQYMQNTVQLSNGNGTFSEVAELCGVANTDWSWTSLFSDFDNDGLKDLLITNGMKRDIRNNDYVKNVRGKKISWLMEYHDSILALAPMKKQENFLFKNSGALAFEPVSEEWGLLDKTWSHGAVATDLDRDGDLDIVINDLDDFPAIYKNTQVAKGNFLRVKLEGGLKNSFGLGARVFLYTEMGSQMQEMTLTRGYLSSVEPVLHFGLSDKCGEVAVKVLWPNGREEKLKNVDINTEIILKIKNSSESINVSSGNKLIRERNASSGLVFSHNESSFDDFQKEVLLPYRYSKLGPALSVGDIDGDGLEDIHVGGASGQSGMIYKQLENGQFKELLQDDLILDKKFEDVVSEFIDVDNDSDLDLYVGSGSTEWSENSIHYEDRIYLNNGSGQFDKDTNKLPKFYSSTGVVAPTDWDNDGDQDLFIGGRIIPGKYPFPAASKLLLNENGSYEDVTQQLIPELNKAGLVTDAKWVDLNSDGLMDLVIASEWQDIRVYLNHDGSFLNVTDQVGLSNYSGWWMSLNVSDVNGDGFMDIVAGNLGRNSRYHSVGDLPFEVYSGDFDGNNVTDIVLTVSDKNGKYPLRGRECSSQQMPFIKEKYKTYHDFATAKIPDIYGEKLKEALHYSANWMNSTLFLNDGKMKFEAFPLPDQAQISTVQAIEVLDIDNDGIKEILVAGNLYETEVETPRQDASIGLVIKVDKEGGMSVMSWSDTGWFAYGDVKNMSIIKDQMKRNCILLGTNNGELRYFQIGP